MKKLKSLLIVIFGNFCLAVAVVYFILPYNIVSGGVSGISLIVEGLWGINPTIMIDALMIVTFILGYIFLGKEFAMKTAVSSLVYPAFVTILGFFPYEIVADKLLVAIFGAVITGLGVGLAIREGASTGGTDIPPLVVNKLTGWPIHVLLMIMDAIVILCGVAVIGMEMVFIGLIFTYITNMVANKVMVPNSESAVSLFIISEKYEEIMHFIHSINRGCTILDGKGGYTGQDKNVILTVVSKMQYAKLEKKVNEIDPYAFVIVANAREIKGEGFTYDVRVQFALKQ